jgi:hypothetical protein
MGNSDTHGINGGVGYPRTFIFVDDDEPAAVTEAVLRDTVRRQRTAIGEGCLITLGADGAPRMGVRELVDADTALSVRLQAPPHVTVGRLELYVGGRVVPLTAIEDAITVDEVAGVISLPLAAVVNDGVERLNRPIEGLAFGEDAVVVAVSRGGTGLAPTGGGEAICVSPPLYVDGDGDGVFSPPLQATEDVTRPTP